MSSQSPDAVLYDLSGNPLAVQNATTIPTATSALLVAGSDGTNSRYLTVDGSGSPIVVGAGTAGSNVGGVITIQGVSGGVVVPVSGTVASTQSGTWTVQPGSTPNTSPWLMTINQGGNSAAVVAKGTQGTDALAVQNLVDSGRTSTVFMCTTIAGVTTEALLSLTPIRGTTIGSAATTQAVTSGKTLRLQSLILTVRNTSAAAAGAIIRVRMLAGTVLIGSQEYFSLGATVGGAISGQASTAVLPIPDGFEISGTTQIGISQLCSATTASLDVSLICVEY